MKTNAFVALLSFVLTFTMAIYRHDPINKKDLPGEAWRGERATVLTLLAALLLLQVAYIFRYHVNMDELQHLHVVWGWAHGLLQYRDVFDNHAPLFHLLCTPLFLAFGEQSQVLFQMRLVTLSLYTLTLWNTYLLGCTLFSRRVGLWAAVFTGLFPGFFLCALEFRTDDLWTVLWLLTLTVLVKGRLTLGRSFLVGVFLGAALGTSMKTILLFVALSAAVLATAALTARSCSRPSFGSLIRCVGTALIGFLLVPLALTLFFVFEGAWAPFFYGTVQHNVLPQLGLWRHYWAKMFLFPLTLPLLWWGARALLCNAPNVGIGARRVVVFLATGGYLSVLVSFWPLLTREDYLPFYPPFILLLTPAILSLPQWITRRVSSRWSRCLLSDIRTPVLVAVVEIILLLIRGSIWRNDARPVVERLADVLRLTEPNDVVMDMKGELVFRERAFYYGLEPITRERIRRGLIADDIPERLIATHTCVAVVDDDRLPPRGRTFLHENYLSVGRLWVAGRLLSLEGADTVPFDVQIPTRYAIVAENGSALGWLDGTPYEGTRFLAPGHHEFRPATNTSRLALVWAQAVERGFSPFPLRGESP